MKKLLNLKNVAIALLACWTIYSTDLPHRVLSALSRAVEHAQSAEITRLAGTVNALEDKEHEVGTQIESTERLTELAGSDDAKKLDRRVNHLKAKQAQLFVKKGEVVDQIDELADSHRRVVEQRDVALNYAGSTESLVLKQQAATEQTLAELKSELGAAAAQRSALEAEKSRLSKLAEEERQAREQERTARLQLEKAVLEALRSRAAESQSTSKPSDSNAEPTAGRSSPREQTFVVVRHTPPTRVPTVFESACRSRSSCR